MRAALGCAASGGGGVTHPTHSFDANYCRFCGTLDRATNGIPQAPCAKAPAPPRQSHQFNDLSGRCCRCGAHCMSIDAKLRCVPVDADSEITEGYPV